MSGDRSRPPARHSAHSWPWKQPGDVRRIAVVRPGQLGDLLLAIPGLRALREGFPNAEIDLIAQPWAADFARRFPCIDRVLVLQDAPPETPSPCGRRNATAHYDLALQIQGDDPSAARLALALGSRATVGFCRDERIGSAFHLLLPMLRDEPEVFRVMRLVRALGVPAVGTRLEFPLLPEDEEALGAVPGLRPLLERRPLIAIHPGARAPARRWPVQRFAELAHLLHRRRGATLLLVGSAAEEPLAQDAKQRSGVPAFDLAGRLSLGGLAALLRRVDLFLGNDSGPAQLAAAVASRSLRVFGPANRHRWAPLDRANHRIVFQEVGCSPCDHWDCPTDHRCLQRVSVGQVLREAELLLRQATASPSSRPSAASQGRQRSWPRRRPAPPWRRPIVGSSDPILSSQEDIEPCPHRQHQE